MIPFERYSKVSDQCNDIAAYSLQCGLTLRELEELIKRVRPGLMSHWKEIKRERSHIRKLQDPTFYGMKGGIYATT